jgi:hypothetical protein
MCNGSNHIMHAVPLMLHCDVGRLREQHDKAGCISWYPTLLQHWQQVVL